MKRALAAFAILISACHDHEHDSQKGEKRSDEHREAKAGVTASMTPTRQVLTSFFEATTCEQRAKLILFPEHNVDLLRSQPCNPISAAVPSKCEIPKTGDVSECSVNVELAANGTYWLARQADGSYLIDLRASWIKQPELVAFRAQLPTKPTVMRLVGELSTYYNYEFSDKHTTHYSVAFKSSGSESLYGYIAKDQPDGQVMFSLLKDGKRHPMTVALQYLPQPKSPQIVVITRLLATSFAETEAEHALDSDAGP